MGCRFVGCDYGHGYRDEIEGAGTDGGIASIELPQPSITAVLSNRTTHGG